MIAASTLVVTAVGVWVGLMAIWGYRTFQEEVGKRAAAATLGYLRGSEVKESLTVEAKGILADLFTEWKESNELAASQPKQEPSKIGGSEESEKEPEKEKVGRSYRKHRKEKE